jgi:hypothetical protein
LRKFRSLLIFVACLLIHGNAWSASPLSTNPSVGWLQLDSATIDGITVNHGQISWSDTHVLDGNKSIRWDYEQRGTLTIPYLGKPLGYVANFFLGYLVAGDAPLSPLKVEFSQGSNPPVCTLEIIPSRPAWNRAEVSFSVRDAKPSFYYGLGKMTGCIDKQVNRITITAPSNHSGTFYLGEIYLGDEQKVRFDNIALQPLTNGVMPPTSAVTPEEMKACRLMEERMDLSLREDHSYSPMPLDWEGILKEYAVFQPEKVGETWHATLNPSTDPKALLGYDSPVLHYCQLMFRVARLIRQTNDTALKAKALTMYDTLWDYSRYVGGMPDFWGGGDGYVESAFLLRDHLRETHRLTPAVLNEILDRMGNRRIYAALRVPLMMPGRPLWGEEPGEDCDYSRLGIPKLFLTLLLEEDTPEKMRDLHALSSWMDRVVLQNAPGNHDTFKADGSTFHHHSFIPGYGRHMIYEVARLFYILSETPFAIPERGHEFFRSNLMRDRFLMRKNMLPITLGGKEGLGNHFNIPLPTSPYLYMAIAGTPDHAQPFDQEVGSVWLRMLGENSAKENAFHAVPSLQAKALSLCESMNLKPEAIPSGHATWPYAALAIHRREDWLLQIKGYSQYIYSREAGQYFSYLGYGTMELLTSQEEKQNYYGLTYHDIDIGKPGFDWSKYPGTTTVFLPTKQLKWPGWKQHYSDEAFVGGVDGTDGNGLFSLTLHGDKELKLAGFHARKSWFCFSDTILCLGSGITADTSSTEVGTTLVQEALPKKETPIIVDGSEIRALPWELRTNSAKFSWFLDGDSNGFLVAPGQNLVMQRSHQLSRTLDDKQASEGDWFTAWISHGTTPKDANYAYYELPQTTPEKMQDFQEKLEKGELFQILQCDTKAQIVRSLKDNATAYALFKKTSTLPAGPVRMVDKPCLIYLRQSLKEEKKSGMTLSISDPDLHLATSPTSGSTWKFWGYSQPSVVHVTLEGIWQTASQNGVALTNTATQTTLQITCRDGMTQTVHLTR